MFGTSHGPLDRLGCRNARYAEQHEDAQVDFVLGEKRSSAIETISVEALVQICARSRMDRLETNCDFEPPSSGAFEATREGERFSVDRSRMRFHRNAAKVPTRLGNARQVFEWNSASVEEVARVVQLDSSDGCNVE